MRHVMLTTVLALLMAQTAFAAPKIKAARAQKPPVLDGKLDDACWQKAAPIKGFKVYQTNIPATPQSIGYVAYDDAHLYIAMKCMMEKGKKPQGQMRPHDGDIWADDHVEIMIDPGKSELKYFQLALSPFGATFDCSREQGGAHEDDSWNGEWVGKGYIGDGFYSVELAIPYHNMGLTFDTSAVWGINLCRQSANPTQLSAISDKGVFNDALKFPGVADIGADFSKYSFPIGPGYVQYEPRFDPPVARLIMPIVNRSGRDRDIRIDMYQGDKVRSQSLKLAADQSVSISLEKLPVEPLIKGATDILMISTDPKTTRIEVRDALTDTILQVRRPKPHAFCTVLNVAVTENWRHDMPVGKSPTIDLTVKTSLAKPHLVRGSLTAKIRNKSGNLVDSQTHKRPKATTKLSFDTADLPWGVYSVHVSISDKQGRALAVTDAPAVVLPDGKYQVKILNNFVSELMDTQTRSMGPMSEVDYMNPRNGWVHFNIDGVESMKKLDAGRQSLKLNAPAKRIVIRAIPELIYCQYQAEPHIKPYGPYDWNFLNKHVLKNCNLIVGNDHPSEMKQWRSQGKQWLTHATVPNLVTKNFVNAQDAYAHWTKNAGYDHPLMDGIIADEFLGFSPTQYIAYTKSIRRLRDDPKFDGREFYAWCGAVYGLDAGKAFMRVLLRSGWHHCFERYLPEQTDEAAAKRHIDDTLIRTARGWEEALPGSTRAAVITLGYMNQPNESLNHYPWVNYRVFMDMQFEALANEPDLFGIYGMMEYLSSYTDEEAVRWAGKLYRHYCIEGNKRRFTNEPYSHAHLKNADFDNGVEGWEIKGNARPGHHTGMGWLQGRYPNTAQGDKFLIMKRNSTAPNSFSQTIQGLEPGKVYSLKMFTADYQDLVNEVDNEQVHAVRIELQGIEPIPGDSNSFQFPISNCYSHKLGKFDASHKYWVNYHWRVFRATDKTARITVYDWQNKSEPGGPIGQEIAYNFVEVQPYDLPGQ